MPSINRRNYPFYKSYDNPYDPKNLYGTEKNEQILNK